MKCSLLVLLLVALLNAGCITFPKGVHPWARQQPNTEEAGKPTPKAAPKPAPKPAREPDQSPEVVNPDEVNEKNVREKTRQLEEEIRHDERSN